MKFDYIAEANLTASNTYHGDKVSALELEGVLTEAINALNKLDAIKKSLFYGRELAYEPEHTADAFDNCSGVPTVIAGSLFVERGTLILHSVIGKATEAGELLEALRESISYGGQFDTVNFAEEIGDGFWYDAIGLGAIGLTVEEVQRRNIAKLRHRFPNRFTEYDANNRDLFGERQILEGNGIESPVRMILNKAAERGLKIEVSGPTGCGKTVAANAIRALIPNATVTEQ